MSRTTYNKFNQLVYKACFSCQKCVVISDEYRCACKGCHLQGQVVKRNHCCELWEMKDGLQNAGRGGGQVKKRKYLVEFSHGRLMKDVNGARMLYEKQYGSIYEAF